MKGLMFREENKRKEVEARKQERKKEGGPWGYLRRSKKVGGIKAKKGRKGRKEQEGERRRS